MKQILIITTALIFSSNLYAQKTNSSSSYKSALGIKFYPGGISYKNFVNGNNALELIGYFWNKGSRITGLYEIHNDFPALDGLKWYVGPGAHIGFYNSKYGGANTFGVDGVLGLDYKIRNAPLNISADWQPSFEFGENFGNGFASGWGGLAIRYTF